MFVYSLLIVFYILYYPYREIRAALPTETARAALPSCTRAFWGFSCFRNPSNFDMDYRIFNARTYSFLCVYTYGGWAHRQRVSTTFLSQKKLDTCFFLLLTGFEPRVLDLGSDAVPVEPCRHLIVRLEVCMTIASPMTLTVIQRHTSFSNWTTF